MLDLVPALFGAVCVLEELELPDRDAPPGAPLVPYKLILRRKMNLSPND